MAHVTVRFGRCPITANCPITLSDYNFADLLEQNTAVYAPITFEEIVIVMIKRLISRCAISDVLSQLHILAELRRPEEPPSGAP